MFLASTLTAAAQSSSVRPATTRGAQDGKKAPAGASQRTEAGSQPAPPHQEPRSRARRAASSIASTPLAGADFAAPEPTARPQGPDAAPATCKCKTPAAQQHRLRDVAGGGAKAPLQQAGGAVGPATPGSRGRPQKEAQARPGAAGSPCDAAAPPRPRGRPAKAAHAQSAAPGSPGNAPPTPRPRGRPPKAGQAQAAAASEPSDAPATQRSCGRPPSAARAQPAAAQPRRARFGGAQAANGTAAAGPAQPGADAAAKRPVRTAAAAAAAAAALSARGITVPTPAPPDSKPSARPSSSAAAGGAAKPPGAAMQEPLRRLRRFEADGETFSPGDAAFLVTEDGGDYQVLCCFPTLSL